MCPLPVVWSPQTFIHNMAFQCVARAVSFVAISATSNAIQLTDGNWICIDCSAFRAFYSQSKVCFLLFMVIAPFYCRVLPLFIGVNYTRRDRSAYDRCVSMFFFSSKARITDIGNVNFKSVAAESSPTEFLRN